MSDYFDFEQHMNRVCVHCGHTYGAHHGGTSPWPRDYCPGPNANMDWENGPGTTFKEKEENVSTDQTRIS